MAIAQSVIIGIISGVVSSICYALMKQLLKPKVKIADILVRRKDLNFLVVKVINRSKVPIRDVECYMIYYERVPDGYVMEMLETNRPNASTIDKYINDRDDSNAASSYAVQYAFCIPDDIRFKDDDKVIFSFRAIHPISGTAVYKTQEYRINTNDIREDVLYVSGDNIGVHKIS